MANVIDRVATILKSMTSERNIREWGASELARRSGIPVGTVHRILLDLKEHGFVAQNPENKKFRLGMFLMELGFNARENLSIIETARPVLTDLTEKTEETAHLTVQDGYEGVLIDKVESRYELRIVAQVGMRTPLTKGALKKVILAFLSPDEIEKIMDTCPGADEDASQIREELKEIRSNGYALSFGEVMSGTVAIASPIFNHRGKVIASIGVMGPESRFTERQMPGKIKCVLEAGRVITTRMGGKINV